MGPLGAQTRATCFAVLAVTLAIATASAGVRLLPWILDPRVPWGAVAVFARGLAAVTLEASTAVALPIGYALAAAAASDRGEARACALVGASPWGLARSTWPLAAAVAALALGASLAWGGARAEPVAVVRALVEASRAACGDDLPVADVPGAGAAWLCASRSPPRLAAIAGDAVVVAEGVSLEVGRVELTAATLALRGPPEVRVRAGAVVLHGLGTFAAPAGAAGRARGVVLVLASAFASVAVMAALLAANEPRRVLAGGLGAATALVTLGFASVIEHRLLPAPALAFLPFAALAPAGLHAAVRGLVRARQRGALREASRGGTALTVMGRIGPGEILLLALLALLLFGASRISDIGKGLGEGIKNFKKGLKDVGDDEPPKQIEKGSEADKKALDPGAMARTLARRLDAVAPSATLAMNARAIKLREAGHKVYGFGVGEPDFPTPAHIVDAAYEAAKKGATRYTAVSGTASLKKAICASTRDHRGWTPTPDQVVVSVGAKHALFNIALALYEAGDEVIIPAPYWVSYPEQVRVAGATAVHVSTRESEGFRLSPAALEAAITPKTKALILCSPSNPTGGAYARAHLAALAEVIAKHDFWVVVDEIYADLVYDGFEAVSLAVVAPALRDRLVIVDGVSKTFAMTGWRIGWTISPPALAKALDTMQSQSTSNAAAISQAAAEAALVGPRDELVKMRAAFAKRRDLMVEGLRSLPGVTCRTPEGAFYAFADFSAHLGKKAGAVTLATDEDVATYLLDEAHVATVGGTPFGAPGYLRLSYAVGDDDIRGGIEAMRAALAKL